MEWLSTLAMGVGRGHGKGVLGSLSAEEPMSSRVGAQRSAGGRLDGHTRPSRGQGANSAGCAEGHAGDLGPHPRTAGRH